MIKTWKKFIESISGWELIGKDMGPNYPEQKLPTTLTNKDTSVIEGSDGIFYTHSDYMELYNSLLKKTVLDPDLRSFTKINLELLLQIMNK
jgi:hypothetical protein